MDLIEKMRKSNYEQFVTLVRMHLSFELDVNTTDDNDVVLNEKLKSKKRFNFHKKAKICTTTTSISPLCSNSQFLCREGILQLRELMNFLVQEQNITQEGIFRRTGSLARQNDLKSKINNGVPLNLEEGAYTVHDCASVFKGILSELPEPLLTDTYNVAHVQIAELCNNLDNSKEPRLIHSIQLLLLLLPPDNYNLLKDIIEMLHQTTKFVASNKMSASSLATLFTPHLICPKKLTPEALHQMSQQMSGIISFMISKGTDLFDVPPNLAVDIRAYFVKEQQKALSPEHFLDESTSDSIANTVYTFVDKERTAQACVSGNPTDTALAQLYAHIQTLPESSKKRKLIKQFNKENGQGTPLQMLNRLKNTNSSSKPSKSLGDSIKRHIFHKSLASRSGTKQQRSSPAFNTPTRTQPFTPKSRQLFQSPYIPRQLQSDNNVQLISSKLSFASPATIDSTKALKALNNKVTAPVCIEPVTESLTKKDDDDDGENADENLSEDEVDSFELLSETLNRLQNTSNCSNKKTVAFNVRDDRHEADSDGDKSEVNKSAKDFKSFHKSEPDLSKICVENTTATTPLWNNGRFITSKLMKGVSMVNLKCPSFIDRKILRKSSSIQLKRKSSTNDLCVTPCKEHSMIDDEDFEETPNKDENSLDWSPESHLRRRSMSPITKSTQRMSKAMQESIMTPRSRKPVMLIGASLGSSDQRNYQNSFSSLKEEDEDSSQLHSLDTQEQRSLYRSKSAGNLNVLNADNLCQLNMTGRRNSSSDMESLSAPFREYLLSRSVCTGGAPVDASFSSQPDDFGSTEDDIQNLTETELSQSLLYCLNGNIPADMSPSNLSPIDSRIDLPSRKRTMDIRPNDGYQAHKRMLVRKNVLLEHPGETSL